MGKYETRLARIARNMPRTDDEVRIYITDQDDDGTIYHYCLTDRRRMTDEEYKAEVDPDDVFLLWATTAEDIAHNARVMERRTRGDW